MPVVAINTLSVNEDNEGTRTMLERLLPALQSQAPEIELRPIVSTANRHLFAALGPRCIELEVPGQSTIQRIRREQFDLPKRLEGVEALVDFSGVRPFRARVPQVVVVSSHLAIPSCARAAGDDGLRGLRRSYYGVPFRRSVRTADRVLGISQFVADALVDELGVSPERVAAMPLGVDVERWSPSARPREPIVLFVGTLYAYKDADVAVRAFAAARGRLPSGARFVVAGKDPTGAQLPALRTLARELEVEDVVDLLGMVSDDELRTLYDTASLLVLPSRCEGFGLPVAEAMACGLPVAVAGTSSLPEVVGDAGLIVAPGDVAGFADAMTRVAGDVRERDRLSYRGLERVRALTWTRAAAVLVDAVRSVLDEVPGLPEDRPE